MSDRLKQIWSGFEHQTSRHLTGQGIDNIHVPSRREWRADDSKFLPGDFEAPADRAFAALEYKLATESKKHGRRRSTSSKKRHGAHHDADQRFEQAYGPGEPTNREMAAGDPHQALLASLRETDFRVLRREINYSAQASDVKKGRKKSRHKGPGRKKFLGIF